MLAIKLKIIFKSKQWLGLFKNTHSIFAVLQTIRLTAY